MPQATRSNFTLSHLSDAMEVVRLEVGHVTEDVGSQTGDDADKSNIVKTDESGVVYADIGYCPV